MEVKDMRRFINPTILGLCLVALVAGAATETSIDYAQVAEDIDVMAKIIDKTLEAKFPEEYKASSLFRESHGCQGIYLKGYGAIFITSIGFPVAEQKPPEEKATPDDLWQRTKYELRGGQVQNTQYYTQYFVTHHDASGAYDSGKVEQLEEELLKLIGTYAPNIRQLGSQGNVVIAVRGTTTPRRAQVSVSHTPLESEYVTTAKHVSKQTGEATESDNSIPYKLAEPADVTIKIHDLKGQLVRTLKLGQKDAGKYTAHWDGKNDDGKKVASGIYFYSIKAGDFTDTGKLVVVKQTKPDYIVTTGTVIPQSKPESTEPPKPVAQVPKPESGATEVSEIVVVPKVATVSEPVEVWVGTKDGSYKEAAKGYSKFIAALSPRSDTGRTTLIVKASKKSIMAYKDGKFDFDAFMKEAEITQY
jgi:hypothetical protein